MELRPLDDTTGPDYPPRRFPAALRKVGHALAGLGICATLFAGGCGSQSEHPVRNDGVTRYVEMVRQAQRDGSPNGPVATDGGPGSDGGVRDLRYCVDSPPRLSGDRNAVWLFSCAAELSESMEVHDFPQWIGDGRLCDAGERAWSRLRVAESQRTTITSQGRHIGLTIYSPDGSEVGRLGPQRPCVTLTMEPGVWVLVAEPVDPDHGSPQFELFFDREEEL